MRGEDVSRSLKLLCLKQNIENLSTIQERSGYLLRQPATSGLVAYPDRAAFFGDHFRIGGDSLGTSFLIPKFSERDSAMMQELRADERGIKVFG